MNSFKQSFSFDVRKEESSRIKQKYPEKLPIIVEKGSGDITATDKKVFSSHDFTIAQFTNI